MSSEIAVVVDDNSSDDGTNEPSRDESTPGVEHASDTLIDAGIASGVAAERANDAAGEAEAASFEASMAAAESHETADRLESQQNQLAAVAADLRATSENLAAVAAAQAAGATQDGLLENPDAVDDGVVDVEPSNDHWLTRKWNIPGFRNRKEQV